MAKPKTKPSPVLRLVESDVVSPTRKLHAHGQRLFDQIMGEYDIADASGLEILTQTCEALDRTERLREIIDKQGEVSTSDSGLAKLHPAIAAEMSGRALVLKGLAALGVGLEPVKAMGRPPAPFGRG